MGGRKRRRGRADLKDFARDLNGNYQYTGVVYRYGGAGPFRRELAWLWAAAGCMAGMTAAAGCLPAAGMTGCFYVLLPYVGGFVAAVSVVWALARLTAGGETLRGYVYEATVLALPGRAALAAVLAAAGAAGEGVYLLRHGPQGRLAPSLACLALQAGACAAALALRRLLRRQKWEK